MSLLLHLYSSCILIYVASNAHVACISTSTVLTQWGLSKVPFCNCCAAVMVVVLNDYPLRVVQHETVPRVLPSHRKWQVLYWVFYSIEGFRLLNRLRLMISFPLAYEIISHSRTENRSSLIRCFPWEKMQMKGACYLNVQMGCESRTPVIIFSFTPDGLAFSICVHIIAFHSTITIEYFGWGKCTL